MFPFFINLSYFFKGGDKPYAIAAGLPNITASYDGNIGYANCDMPENHYYGALAFSNPASSLIGERGPSDGEQYYHCITFDASKCNSIYGNSETVQPPAIQLLPQIRF